MCVTFTKFSTAYSVKAADEIQMEKLSFQKILRDAAKEKQESENSIAKTQIVLREAKEILQNEKANKETAEMQMVQAEKCLALLNEVKSVTLARLELGGF